MSNELKELADELENHLNHEAYYPTGDELSYFAGGLIAAGYRKPRTVTTAAELDALPVGSVVLDKDGDPWQSIRNSGLWWCTDPGIEYGFEATELLNDFGPATILHEGPTA